MIFPKGYLVLVIVSTIICLLGFYRFVWFLSVGYGLAVAGIGATNLVMMLINRPIDILYLIQCLLFIVYGIRLGGFLLIRELKNAGYREKMNEAGGDAKLPIFVTIPMWLYCGFSYVVQSSGPVYRLLNNEISHSRCALIIGIVISAIGIVMESVADKQKSKEKEINPDMPAMNGLYKLCRCPNYFGEVLFWTGNLVSGIGVCHGGQIAMLIIGYIIITFIMMSGAKRVEGRHIKHYGDDPRYIEYSNTVPLIIPFVPIYHFTSKEKMEEEARKKAEKKAKKDGK